MAGARTIFLNFKTRALEKAKELAKQVNRQMREAAKAIKDVDRRRKVQKGLKERAKQEREGFKAEDKRLRLAGRAAALRGRDAVSGRDAADPILSRANALREKAFTVSGLFRGGGLSSGAATLGALGEGVSGLIVGLGPAAALAGAVAQIVAPIIEEKFLAQLKEAAVQQNVLMERRLREFRLEELARRSPEFRFDQAERVLEEDKAAAASGWHRRGSNLRDFGF